MPFSGDGRTAELTLEYMLGYVVFGILFLAGAAGYWWMVRSFRDPSAIYVDQAADAPRASGDRGA